MSIRAFAAALLLTASSRASAEPIPPTAKWVVNFDDQQCLAEREYGTPTNPLTLVLKQPVRGDVIQVAVLASGNLGTAAVQVDGWIGFDRRPVTKVSALRWRPQGSKQVIRLINMPLSAFRGIETAQVMRVDVGAFRRDFRLSDVRDLLTVMDSCLEDLRQVWNVADGDGDGHSAPAGARPPVGDLRGLISASDYPGVALQQLQSGSVTMVLLIDEAGRVADCSLIETSGVAALDAQSCSIVTRRARLTPAVGADGKPRKSSFIQRITWKLG